MTEIPGTTLFAVDCVRLQDTAYALRRCLDACRFERAMLLTDRDFALEGVETVRIPTIGSIEEFCDFMAKRAVDYVETERILHVHWDGFVVDPGAWTDEFLDYDYIGAVWPWLEEWKRVGNGGFSLRSRRLLEALRDPRIVETRPEDVAICRTYRPLLEERYGIRFAPEEIANLFSVEHGWSPRHFGFHGTFHLPRFRGF